MRDFKLALGSSPSSPCRDRGYDMLETVACDKTYIMSPLKVDMAP